MCWLRKGKEWPSEGNREQEKVLGNEKWDCNRKNSVKGLNSNFDAAQGQAVNLESWNLKECRARGRKRKTV